MKKKQEINVIVVFTDGWEERVAKAACALYLKVEKERMKTNIRKEEIL